ncbi:LLM class flavin-dependent oxidoreductase [Cohnella sp. LGH]|uniref:FMN-dependent oxidoreductase (Nitrilotriacetate monooxygenase family) n=3 Tax=Cohnella TaxID=329857 RepID=A0A3D9IZI5_9BACL|nr:MULTISPECIES: LLM class flavin-dependent oxidoreductase [Cohnella]QTH44322.1 LLM class flavin-dependent oxidoreductase [Cohnella sp. LGH]RED66476.1 FMN-dependent oxidoreductase (nitrilotriacetate monooxygenase family) [Cohnella phaseoli]
MGKQIRLNAFDMNTAMHSAHGLWKHPASERHRYKDLRYWVELAQLLERGLFDALFLADVYGFYDVFRGNRDAALRDAVQVPVNDPSLIIPTMAYATEHLSFAVTIPTTYEPPYAHARRMSTLDHLTGGRVGWNIVTSFLPSAAKNFGLDQAVNHDRRYEVADEYMEVVYKLWEASWEEDAVVRDAVRGIYTDPSKVHEINHEGRYYNIPGPHLSEPSPQRTPVLYQAGTSAKGREFAAKHAECVFIDAHNYESLKFYVDDIRTKAVSYGRKPEDVKVFMAINSIVGRTRAEAEEKLREYTALRSEDAPQVLYGGFSGIDLSKYDRSDYLSYFASDHGQAAVARFTTMSEKRMNVGEVVDEIVKIGGRSALLFGSAEEVADQMQAWVEKTGIDGFNLAHLITPGSLKDIIDLVVPILQERGLYKTEYAKGTMREKLFGPGASRLPDRHPGAAFRRAGEAKERSGT